MKKIFYFSFLLILLESSTCHKQLCEITYNFELSYTITEQDSFRLGDTIWLTYTINNILEDKLSKKTINISNFDFKVYCAMGKMDTSQFDQAEKYFNFINKTGRFDIKYLSNTIQTSVIYNQQNNERLLKIGMIPQKIGIFQITFFNLTDDLINTKLTNNKCLENINLQYKMNEGRDFNYYLIQKSLQPIVSEEEYKKGGTYAFKVIK